MSKKMIYGIDLGTTYSCLAYVDENDEVRVVENPNGQAYKRILPSAIFYGEDGLPVVGEQAKNNSMFEPERYKAFFKCDMGEVDPDSKGTIKYKVAGKDYSPQELSALVLATIVEIANTALKQNVKDVVVTVPAYFGQEARNATKDAIKMAGLNEIDIICEPVAAAVAYQHMSKLKGEKNVLVYDLGGGTFDAALVKVSDKKCETIAHHGNPRLGGKNWDEAVINNILIDRVADAKGKSREEVLDDLELYQTIVIAAETFKKALTDSEKATQTIAGKKISMTRDEFDAVTRDLLENTIELINEMYANGQAAGENHPKPELILLVGGSSRMPQVRQRLEQLYSGVPIESYDPDEAVAKGAAIYASRCVVKEAPSGEIVVEGPKGVVIGNAKSYGMVLLNDNDVLYVHNYIRMNEDRSKPVEATVYTVSEGQTSVKIEVYENIYEAEELSAEVDKDEKGERLMVNRQFVLKKLGAGTLKFGGPMPRRSPVNMTFDMTKGNMLTVIGQDPKSKAKEIINIPIEGQIDEKTLKAAKERISMELKASREQ